MKIDNSVRKQDIRTNMRDGKGDIIINHVLDGENLPSNIRLFGEITVNPGCSIGVHAHETESEIFYILEGELTIDDNGEKKTFVKGDSCVTGGGAAHGVENIGDKPAKMLAIIVTA